MLEPGTGEGVNVSERDRDRPEWFAAAKKALEGQPGGKDQKLLASKLAVLEKLPSTIVEELHAFLHSRGDRNVLVTERDTLKFKGELFERLVTAEFFRESRDASVDFNSPAAEELLGLIQDPGRYRLFHELGRLRNPDLVAIGVTPEGELVVKAVAEIKAFKKSAHKDKKRLIQQLEPGGFRRTLDILASLIDSQGETFLRDHGLVNILERGGKVTVAPDLDQLVFIPRNTKFNLPPQIRVKVTRSKFSHEDVGVLASMFMGFVEERINGGGQAEKIEGKEI